jgi:Ca2+-binding RTX toxin-like protein
MTDYNKIQHLKYILQPVSESLFLKPNPEPDPDPEPPPPEKLPPEILDLAPIGIRTMFGKETFLDVGSDATLKLGSAPLKKLQVYLPQPLNSFEHLGLSQNDHVRLSDGLNPGSVISVDGVEIGTIPTAVDQWVLTFAFNGNATPERVQELIRCLTYTNKSQDHFIYTGDIEIMVVDTNGKNTSVFTNVIVAPEGAMVLGTEADHFTGKAGDDVFYALNGSFTPGDIIFGGEGFDTLMLEGGGQFDLFHVTGLVGIEKIQGSDAEESLVITSGQLAVIQSFDGGGSDPKHGSDFLQLDGSYFDLTGKEIVNFEEINLVSPDSTVVVDDVEMAKLIGGITFQGETLILTQGTLTDAERLAIHRRGIDTIITLADGTTTKHEAPKISALDGDHVTMSSAVVHIDAGKNVKIESDDGLLGYLDVAVLRNNDDSEGSENILEIDTSSGRIQLSDGLKASSRVTIGGIDIGAIAVNYIPESPGFLPFTFNENATPALVEELIQAITYRNANGRIDEAKVINIELGDIGNRPTNCNVTINPEDNKAPDNIELSATKVAELSTGGTVIGDLSAHDDNFGERFTYSLTSNPGGRFDIVDGKLVVKQGVKLDYEQAKSHVVKIMVEDIGGLTFEKSFTITVTDVNPEITSGSSGRDVIVGGAGRDRLSSGAGADNLDGGRGDDVLTGGSGRDILTGGAGNDKFVFMRGDTSTGTTRDTIVDFRHGSDRIDLARIDADTSTRTDNRFTALLGADKAFTKAGQLRYDAKTGVLSGNTDGDAQAEFEIWLKNKPALLTLSDFAL